MASASFTSRADRGLRGDIVVPGDKSISHRALMLGAIASGTTRITGFLDGADCRATAAALTQLGVRIDAPAPTERLVHGVGPSGLRAADGPLDLGNSGTGIRLLTGLLAGQSFDSVLTGDVSLRSRPMRRISEPLAELGARIATREGRPPIHVSGGQTLHGARVVLPVASAQVKSALLLAALQARGETIVVEPAASRDHTERMLGAFGARVDCRPGYAALRGPQRLTGVDVAVPADPSSAAFFVVAATLVPGSELLLRNVGINPTRTGLFELLERMGASIDRESCREIGGEPVADLRVRSADLRGIDIPATAVPATIDEFPILFVAAAAARGETLLRGAEELRVKESDRIGAMAAGLRALDIEVDEYPDGIRIYGGKLGTGRVASHGDHRVAMAFAVAGQVARGPVQVDDVANIETSFPGFADLARETGFDLESSEDG